MDAKGQLERLLRIQELAIQIRDSRAIVEGAPGRVEQIEQQFRERNAEYVAVQDQNDELELDQRTRSGELKTLEELRDKYKASLMEVKNQREYSAMLKEIDTVKAEISAHEEAILKDMEAIETLKGELETHAEHIKQERKQVEIDRDEVNTAAETARGKIESLVAERGTIESELPTPLRSRIALLETSRQGVFLTKADNGTCLSCFVRVRPQAFQEVRTCTAVHTCSNCRRFLYFEPAFKAAQPAAPEAAAAAEPAPTPSDSSDVEAVNGGTV